MPVLAVSTLIDTLFLSPNWPKHIDNGQLILGILLCCVTEFPSSSALFVFSVLGHYPSSFIAFVLHA
jgi:hypothetical protein